MVVVAAVVVVVVRVVALLTFLLLALGRYKVRKKSHEMHTTIRNLLQQNPLFRPIYGTLLLIASKDPVSDLGHLPGFGP
jgi:hypothetical protein